MAARVSPDGAGSRGPGSRPRKGPGARSRASGATPADVAGDPSRRDRFTLRQKLVTIGLVGIVLTVSVMQLTLTGLAKVDRAGRTLDLVRRAQRLHQDADMMHDALRADLYNAVLASEGRSSDPSAKAIAEFARHADEFTRDLNGIRALHLRGPGSGEGIPLARRAGQVLDDVLPTEESYIATAQGLTQRTVTDRAAVESSLKSFEQLFDRIELQLADVTAQVAQVADKAEADARHEATKVRRQVVFASVVAVAGLMMLVFMLNRLGGRLAGTVARLVRAEQRSREFLAYAAHQLRTPITATRSSAEALMMTGGTPEQEDLLTRLRHETHRAGRLVADLLRIARLDQGEISPAAPCNVMEVCADELARMEAQAPALDWRLDVEDPAPERVLLSLEATREALVNLLDNARRHADRTVTVRVSHSAGDLRIEVEDDGPGLPQGAWVSAFDRFVSLDGAGGSGLGLPIARASAEAQGGRLDYDGRRFVLTLPYHAVEVQALA